MKVQWNVSYALSIVFLADFLFVCFFFALPARADEIVGVWVKEDMTTRLRLAPCGSQTCGRLIWLQTPRNDIYNPSRILRTEPLVGQRIMWDLDFLTSKQSLPKGRYYNYDDGRVYDVSVDLQDDKMIIQGCVNSGVICSKTTWLKSE